MPGGVLWSKGALNGRSNSSFILYSIFVANANKGNATRTTCLWLPQAAPCSGPLAGQVAQVVGCRRWKVAVVAEPTIMTIEILSACNRNPNEERGAFKDY